jgi:RimJ/RimL family protein N-acetyltransferase
MIKMSKCLLATIQVKSSKIYKVRDLVIEDAEKLQKFFHQSAYESTHTLQCKERTIPIEKLIEKIKQTHESLFDLSLGVFADEKLIGQIVFRVAYPEHPWIKHVGEFGMTILKEYWGQGIGTALIGKMELFAKNVGINRIEAKVRVKNDRGLALYQKCGYAIEGIRKNAVLIDGIFEDEYYIAKILK